MSNTVAVAVIEIELTAVDAKYVQCIGSYQSPRAYASARIVLFGKRKTVRLFLPEGDDATECVSTLLKDHGYLTRARNIRIMIEAINRTLADESAVPLYGLEKARGRKPAKPVLVPAVKPVNVLVPAVKTRLPSAVIKNGKKKCSKCEVTKPLEDYYAANKDGRMAYCKTCHKAATQRNKTAKVRAAA